jgi:hypothetical protein
MLLDDLKQTHPAYESHSKLADYLYRSYIGGDAYRQGAYLTHYYGEDTAGGGNQYAKRLRATPLNNYVKTTIDIYRSFLFRDLPARNLGNLTANPLVEQWLRDTDQEGQSMDSFLKTANDLACVMGNVWILVDKPSYAVETQAQEIALGIRAYACVYTPKQVMDWSYERTVSGKKMLTMIKVIENETRDTITISVWTPAEIHRYTVKKNDLGDMDMILDEAVYTNPLGYIPFINHAPLRKGNGMGFSLVEDVADTQRFIYNKLSELEQTIRISSHPSLVKTASTNAVAGAGAIITVPEDLDPGLYPSLLQPTGASVTGILDSIASDVEAIMRMTHTSAVQAVKGSAVSGVALQTERQLLNAKLSDLADTVEETEIKMWQMWSDWQNIQLPRDFSIEYSRTFDMRDAHSEIELYRKAAELVPHDKFQEYIHKDIVDMIVEDPDTARSLKANIEEEHARGMQNPQDPTQA